MDSQRQTNHQSAEFAFRYVGRQGFIRVTCVASVDPAALGKPEHARGFPACTATLEFEGKGYDAFFGWIQWVCSSNNSTGGSGFDLDPLGWFPDARNPYAFFGLLPTLFDAPSRRKRKKMFWRAHSFLGATPSYNSFERVLRLRKVLPIAGFSWGFDIDDGGEFSYAPIAQIEPKDWNDKLPLLRKAYPTWTFPEVTEFG
jgi:hypothetical protein